MPGPITASSFLTSSKIIEKEEVRKKRSYGPNLRVNLRLLFLYEMKIRDWRINLRFSWNTGPWTSYFSSLFLINNKEKELRREVQPGPSYQEIQRLSTKRYFPFFPFYFKVKWKRKSFVTAGETWLVIPSFIRSWLVAGNLHVFSTLARPHQLL